MQALFAALHESAVGRFCCKSLFALVIKISFGCTHDFRVEMWGTSLREDKLAGDLGNVIEATSILGRRPNFFTAEKLAPHHLGLLQQYRHKAAEANASNLRQLLGEQRKCMDGRPRLPSTQMTHKRHKGGTRALHCRGLLV
jgi:hypothetical protein